MKLLLVEDESITRRGMMKHIPWGELGIETVKAAESADRALEICETWCPDIILSDIRMRGMDGIEMCRELSGKMPDSQIIFLSGYSQKEYLKAAIELGAVQYLEKPVSMEELTEAIGRAAERLSRIKKQRFVQQEYTEHYPMIQKDILRQLLQPLSEEKLESALAAAGIWKEKEKELRVCLLYPQKGGEAFACYLKEKIVTECRKHMSVYCYAEEWGGVFQEKEEAVLILSAERNGLSQNGVGMQRLCQLTEASDGNGTCFLAVGEKADAPDQLWESWQSAQDAGMCLSWMGYRKAAWAGESHRDEFFVLDAALVSEFVQALEKRNPQEAAEVLDKVNRFLVEERAVLNSYVKNIYLNLYACLEQTLGKADRNKQEQAGNIWKQAKTLSELHEGLKEIVQEMMEGRAEPCIPAVAQTIAGMQKRYDDKNLSVAQLAWEQQLSPAYLSAVFRKQTGKTIKQYLIDIRIEHARQLLKENRYKFYQISDMVGYQDAAYFTRLFKAQTGMTPSEYREKVLR